MSRAKYMLLPVALAIVTAAYWFLSYEPAGTVMLGLFTVAMAVMGWILLPTALDIGPTAPVDPEFGRPGQTEEPEPH